MTNSELLTTPRELLGALDRQRLFLLRVESQFMPCPACQKPVNAFAAAGITIDDYDFGETKYAYKCPHCHAELEQIVPFFCVGPLWTWQLKQAWLNQQLAKARAVGDQTPAQGVTHSQ
jgi:endogenous inhibitor of DNA gyrase (YacG/DUF329 family)